uniref:(northern house mosquito) hypothetical protein n=1 Tax=Culex pipiens TaxID=7175 RepID=A0A8D8LE66_CULPI
MCESFSSTLLLALPRVEKKSGSYWPTKDEQGSRVNVCTEVVRPPDLAFYILECVFSEKAPAPVKVFSYSFDIANESSSASQQRCRQSLGGTPSGRAIPMVRGTTRSYFIFSYFVQFTVNICHEK